MLEATPFQMLGWFPFCLEKVNVNSNPDDNGNPFGEWITLGGYAKGDIGGVSSGQITLSLQNAMKLYWNRYSVSGSYEFDTVGGQSPGYPGLVSITANTANDLSEGGEQPVDRLCQGGAYISKITSQPGGTSYLDSAITDFTIIQMYDGSTSDESKFIGYGVNGYGFWPGAFGHWVEYLTFYEAIVTLNSLYSGSGSSYIDDYANVVLSGIHFVCHAFARDITGSSVDAANRTAVVGQGESNYLKSTLDSIEFYTFP